MFNKVIIINNHSIMPSIIYDKHKRKNKGHITQCNFVTIRLHLVYQGKVTIKVNQLVFMANYYFKGIFKDFMHSFGKGIQRKKYTLH